MAAIKVGGTGFKCRLARVIERHSGALARSHIGNAATAGQVVLHRARVGVIGEQSQVTEYPRRAASGTLLDIKLKSFVAVASGISVLENVREWLEWTARFRSHTRSSGIQINILTKMNSACAYIRRTEQRVGSQLVFDGDVPVIGRRRHPVHSGFQPEYGHRRRELHVLRHSSQREALRETGGKRRSRCQRVREGNEIVWT